MLLRQTLLYLPAQLLGPLVQFAAALVWTHWLSPAAYGVLALVMAAQELVFLVCLSWWSHYTMRYLPTFVGDEDRARFGATEQLALAATTLLQSVAVFLVLALMDAEPTGDLVAAALGFTITRSLLHHLSERARSAVASSPIPSRRPRPLSSASRSATPACVSSRRPRRWRSVASRSRRL